MLLVPLAKAWKLTEAKLVPPASVMGLPMIVPTEVAELLTAIVAFTPGLRVTGACAIVRVLGVSCAGEIVTAASGAPTAVPIDGVEM